MSNHKSTVLMGRKPASFKYCFDLFSLIPEVKETYKDVCEAAGVRPQGRTKLRGHLQRLADLGIIEMERAGSKRNGPLWISIPVQPS
jgi:hypothetical protein